jgi:hypothetical protein
MESATGFESATFSLEGSSRCLRQLGIIRCNSRKLALQHLYTLFSTSGANNPSGLLMVYAALKVSSRNRTWGKKPETPELAFCPSNQTDANPLNFLLIAL